MKRRFSSLIFASLLCSIPFLAYDAWNWIRRGTYFIVGGGPLDAAMYWASMPGLFVGGLVVIVVYGNVHNYNLYVAHAVELATNSLFYGCLFWGLWCLARSFIRRRPESDAAA
jgi:hypothetical protein